MALPNGQCRTGYKRIYINENAFVVEIKLFFKWSRQKVPYLQYISIHTSSRYATTALLYYLRMTLLRLFENDSTTVVGKKKIVGATWNKKLVYTCKKYTKVYKRHIFIFKNIHAYIHSILPKNIHIYTCIYTKKYTWKVVNNIGCC